MGESCKGHKSRKIYLYKYGRETRVSHVIDRKIQGKLCKSKDICIYLEEKQRSQLKVAEWNETKVGKLRKKWRNVAEIEMQSLFLSISIRITL